MTRRAEIEAGLADVRRRIAGARAEAGRTDDVRLVVITKFFPAADVRILAELGVTDVGESRHQEAVVKQDECADLGLTWHFIGGLQSNKAAAVTAYADVVESVDRVKLVAPLSRGAAEHERVVDVLLQVSLDAPDADGAGRDGAGRAGADPSDLAALADAVAAAEGLRLRGLMAVAPRDADPDPAFARLGGLHRDLLGRHPDADRLSAGMSGDLESAIRVGATHVRIGSAVLGPRPPVQ